MKIISDSFDNKGYRQLSLSLGLSDALGDCGVRCRAEGGCDPMLHCMMRNTKIIAKQVDQLVQSTKRRYQIY